MYTLFVGRFLVGLGVGVESMVVPVLLSEIAPDAERGKFTTLHQLQVTIGICASSIVGYGLVGYVDNGWKYLQLAILVPCAVQIICASLIPESPRWLLRNGKKKEARDMLQSLRYNPTDADLDDDINAMEAEMSSDTDNSPVTWTEVFSLRRAMIIGLGLMLFQPMTGINAVIFYSTTIFGFAGVKEDILATISVTALNVVMTIVSVNLVDRLGRRSLLLGSAGTMIIALVIMSVTLLALNDNETAQGYLAVASVLLYIMGFAIGLGACVWVVMGEILPTRIRSKATSLFISENWLINLMISLFTLTTIEALGGGDSDAEKKQGVAYLFIIFGGCCVGCFLFIFFNVPETKGKSLEELQTLLYGSMGNSNNGPSDAPHRVETGSTAGRKVSNNGSVQREEVTRALLRPVDPL